MDEKNGVSEKSRNLTKATEQLLDVTIQFVFHLIEGVHREKLPNHS